jgi:hypothetical protein
MSKDLHLSGIPRASEPFDHEAYRRDLRKMTDLELIEESQTHRKVTGLLVLLNHGF